MRHFIVLGVTKATKILASLELNEESEGAAIEQARKLGDEVFAVAEVHNDDLEALREDKFARMKLHMIGPVTSSVSHDR